MTGGFLDADIFRGLAFRILLFLTLALLPFGLISVFQTREIARQANFNSELSLLALTGQASVSERAVLLEAFGAGQALSAVAQIYARDTQACSSFLKAYKRASGVYSFVGYLEADGTMRCSTDDFSIMPPDELLSKLPPDRPQQFVLSLDAGIAGSGPVLLVSQPFFIRSVFSGYMLLAVPKARIKTDLTETLTAQPIDVITFNSKGEIIRSSLASEVIDANMPKDRKIEELVGKQPFVFSADSVINRDRVYAVVPMMPDIAYSMSIWREEDLRRSAAGSVGLSMYLPVLMWLASLVVAFWSLNRLAVRHIRKLGRQMRHFAYNRRVPRTNLGTSVPAELVEIQKSFVRMAESIVRDEAALEDSLRDKNILLKEVHHRVKNNLQLISSIMNMQIRRAQSEDARFVLRRLQDRILSLATVHKNLYQSTALDRVQADALVEEIIGQLLKVGLPAGSSVQVEQSYDAFEMDADDAAPLTLLISEAVTNAMKYIGPPLGSDQAYLDVSMRLTPESDVVFRLANSTTGAMGSEGTGLGTQLITAFARQLNGHVDVGFENNEHVLSLRFPLHARVKDNYDF